MSQTRRVGLFLSGLFLLGLSGPACTETGAILSQKPETSEGSGGGGGTGGAGSELTGGSPGLGGEPELGPGPVGVSLNVDAGDRHTCAVVDGSLYCWGENSSGALGLGDVDARLTPTRVGSEEDWDKVETGNGFSCGLRSGLVWCWGSGSSGQLGAGQFSSSLVPREVPLEIQARDVAVGHDHACAILTDDRLFCWGNNAEGQLAQSDPWSGPGVNSAVPLEVGQGSFYRVMSLGQGHTCGIQLDGSLWCWGRNAGGELGQGAASADQTRTPGQTGSDEDWTAVSSGQGHTCGIRAGELYCWGENHSGQLGVDVADYTDDPTLVPTSGEVEAVEVDTFHTCALLTGGEVWCVGRNLEGQLGDGTIVDRTTLVPVSPSSGWDQISVGRFHTCGVRSGAVLCSGENVDGRLGLGDARRRDVYTPTAVLQ